MEAGVGHVRGGGDARTALAALRQLCHSHDLATWPLDTAAGAVAQAGWTVALKQTFRDAVLGKDTDIVTMRQGLATVAVAEAVLRSANTGTTVAVGA